MNRRTIFWCGSVVLLIAAVAVSVRARRVRLEAEARGEELRRTETALVANAARAEKRLTAAEAQAAELARRGKTPPVSPAPREQKSPRQIPSSSEVIRSDPKLETLYLGMQRGVAARSLGPFFQAQGLSPDQMEKILATFAQSAEKHLDLDTTAATQDAAGRETVARLKKQVGEDLKKAQTEILGEAGYAALADYLAAGGVRFHVTALAGEAALMGVPVDPAQGEALTRALAAASRPDTTTGRSQMTIDWPAVDAEARRILSPVQFELFQTSGANYYNARAAQQLDAAILRVRRDEADRSTKPAPGP